MVFVLCFIHTFVARIYDKSIEEILVKRDEALRNAEEREEKTMQIHTELLEDMMRVCNYIYMFKNYWWTNIIIVIICGVSFQIVKQMKDKTDELKDHTARAHEDTAHTHDLATGLDVDVDWIIDRLKIADESSEEILAKRDEALGKAEEREEETMRIHTTLLGDITRVYTQSRTIGGVMVIICVFFPESRTDENWKGLHRLSPRPY